MKQRIILAAAAGMLAMPFVAFIYMAPAHADPRPCTGVAPGQVTPQCAQCIAENVQMGSQQDADFCGYTGPRYF